MPSIPFSYWLLAVVTGSLLACGAERAPLEIPLSPAPRADRQLDYHKDIQPIFDAKCIACHACNDAPCQLKLEAAAGTARGANKQPVYQGSRTKSMTPTRLFIDAENTAEWRQRGFYSVTETDPENQVNLLRDMLELGQRHPLPANRKLPKHLPLDIKRENHCPLPGEFAEYAEDNPLGGMPYAVTGLTGGEFDRLRQWINQGAVIPPQTLTRTKQEQVLIDRWEARFNQQDPREKLVARWLFEHLFLAHLYFPEAGAVPRYFELLRSATPPGQAIQPIAAVRPNDDPGGDFWYRLRLRQGTIVHKTHITLAITEKLHKRIRSLFFNSNWQAGQLPGYATDNRANPLATFAAIPARARYQFMLDHAEYFTRTFIRGPVCRGQIATDVIRDHFWALFQDPDDDLYVTDPAYRSQVTELLGLPTENEELFKLGKEWQRYRDRRNRYLQHRKAAYTSARPAGPSLSSIWDGDGHDQDALLTIFRHHDSASVKRGLIGKPPQTIWLLDYPLFERTYYNLVANFNVYGNLAHQAQTRLYFDLIRNGAEQNLLRFLPPEKRKAVMADWYQGLGKLKAALSYADIDTATPTAVAYGAGPVMAQFSAAILQRHAAINATPDPINRCSADTVSACARSDATPGWRRADAQLSGLAGVPAKQLKVINFLPEVTYLRVYLPDGSREIYNLFRNRAHSNVAFMFAEEARYQPEKDSLTIYPGVISSYPNFMFNIPADELQRFIIAMRAVNDEKAFTAITDRWGVRRSHPDFWRLFHDLNAYLQEHSPIEAGVLDMNRYENL